MKITSDWFAILLNEFNKQYYINLREFLNKEYEGKSVVPNSNDVYKALNVTPYSNTKCVILGQDPYPNRENACGLAFSVKEGVSLPQSLRNIYYELYTDIGIKPSLNGDLTKWAKEGILLLNTVLTTLEGQSNAHKGIGWEDFTDEIIFSINRKDTPVVFILWGVKAGEKKWYIDRNKHLVIESAHPSPLSASRGFFGSKPFSRTNKFLEGTGQTLIDWRIDR